MACTEHCMQKIVHFLLPCFVKKKKVQNLRNDCSWNSSPSLSVSTLSKAHLSNVQDFLMPTPCFGAISSRSCFHFFPLLGNPFSAVTNYVSLPHRAGRGRTIFLLRHATKMRNQLLPHNSRTLLRSNSYLGILCFS